ncbi:MAG TPA: LEA type 2 family protein [Polyangiaceae bacterium]|nr:LEA type 2 family protein [Polyangiaceae bacterium]
MDRRAWLSLAVSSLFVSACSKPKPPELTPRSVQVSAITPESVELSVLLDARNPNAFPILASSVTASIALQDGTPLGNGSSTEPISIPGDSTAPITAKLAVRFSSGSALLPYAMAMKPLPYRLTGTAKIGGEHLNVDVPFTIDGVLTPEQVAVAGLRGATKLLGK